MRLLTVALDGDAEPGRVLRRLAERARRAGRPPPAALLGDWFGGSAVLVPSLRAEAVEPECVFAPGAPRAECTSGAVGGGWFGYLGYPTPSGRGAEPRLPRAAGGWVTCCAVTRPVSGGTKR